MMIKKILPLLLILMICGCSDRISLTSQLQSLGYSEDDISYIEKYNSEDVNLLYKTYNKELLNVIKDPRCNPSKIKDYLTFYKDFNTDTLFELINNNYHKKSNWNIIKSIAKQKYFILDNLDLYIDNYSSSRNIKDLIAYVNVGAYKKAYTEFEISDTTNEMSVLANKWHFLSDYEPSDLVTINRIHGLSKYDQTLKKEAYDAFVKMYDDAKNEKINIYITSAYRSYEYQFKIFSEYLYADPMDVVDTYSSRPGHSDHQTGLACDILSYGYNFDNFEESKAFEWLNNNAYKYGFILRFPKGKEDITGYMYESWHYRYVGEDLSKFIKENNLTYEEYYAYYLERGITYEGA